MSARILFLAVQRLSRCTMLPHPRCFQCKAPSRLGAFPRAALYSLGAKITQSIIAVSKLNGLSHLWACQRLEGAGDGWSRDLRRLADGAPGETLLARVVQQDQNLFLWSKVGSLNKEYI